MATYLELWDLASSPTITDLRKKLQVAISVKAQAIAEAATPTTAMMDWARSALANPQHYEQMLLHFILADNAGVTTAAISGASDSAVQNAVNAAVDNLLGK